MASVYDYNPDDFWEALGISENSAVYEFTKAFVKTAVTKYENLDQKKGRGKLFGIIGGELAGLGASAGPSLLCPHSTAIRRITALGLQSVPDYVDKLMQAKTKISIISIIDAKSSKSFEEKFLLCFIVFALHTYNRHKASLEYINLEAPGEKTVRENKLQAIQMLAEYAGALCFSALLKSGIKNEDKFLSTLQKKNFKRDLKSQWAASTLVNLYYWAQEEGGTGTKIKKVITPYEFFVERVLKVLDEDHASYDTGKGAVPLDSAGSKLNFGHDGKENLWAFLKFIKPESSGGPTRPALIPVKSLLETKDSNETLDFSWVPIDFNVNIEKYANKLHDFLVRDESFSREVTVTNLVRDLHAKFDKLNEILEQREKAHYLAESNRSLRFQIQKPIQTFTGREKFLADLHRKLKEGSDDRNSTATNVQSTPQIPILVIEAPPGIGKTEAVRMYIHKYGHEYNHIVWIDAENQFSAQAQFRVKLATELRVRPDFHGKPKPFETIVKDIYTKICQNGSFQVESILIIFDNAESLNDDSKSHIKGIEAFLPPPHFQDDLLKPTILITSRSKNWDLYNTIQLQYWTESDCVIFCLKQLNLPDTEENKKDATDLGKLFGHLPLAFQAAVALILKRQKAAADNKYGIKDLLENYEKSDNRTILTTQLIQCSGTGPKKTTIMDLWTVTFQKLLKLKNGDLAIKVFCFAAHLTPFCRTSLVLSSLFPGVEQDDFAQTLRLLEHYFMIEQFNTFFTVHPIIRDIIKETLESGAKSSHVLSQKTFLNRSALLLELSTRLVEYLDANSKIQREMSLEDNNHLVDNFFHVMSYFTELDKMSTKECECLVLLVDTICTLSQSYGLRLDYKWVIDLYRTFVREAEAREGSESHIALTLKKKMAAVLMEQGRYAEAKDIYTQVCKAQRKLPKEVHSEKLVTQACIASVLNCLGDYAGALQMYCAVLVKQSWIKDPNRDLFALGVKFNVATLLCDQGEYSDALQLFERVLKESAEFHGHGADHLFPLQVRTWMAGVLTKHERYDEAIEIYKALLDTSKQLRGPHHRDTLLLKCDYATALTSQGEHEIAQAIFQDVLEFQKCTLSYSMLDLVATENSLAHVQVRLDDYSSAIEIYAHVLAVRLAHLGPEHPLTLNTKLAFAHALSCEKKYDKSTLLFSEVLSGRKKVLGEFHPDTILAMQYLGKAMDEQGEFGTTTRFATNVIELRSRKIPLVANDHPCVVQNQQLLDLSRAKLPHGRQSYMKLMKQAPALHLRLLLFGEADDSVSRNKAPQNNISVLDKRYQNKNLLCCCNYKTWTQVIAVIQIALFGILFFLALSNIGGGKQVDKITDFSELLSHPGIKAVAYSIDSAVGSILYLGTHYEKPILILIWLIVAWIWNMILVNVFVPLFGDFTFSGWAVFWLFILFLLVVELNVCCYYIVYRYRRGLIKHLHRLKEELPSVQFQSVNVT